MTTAATITVTDDDVTDLMPSFGTSTVADQAYTDGTAIADLTLPAATGGDTPLAYSTSSLPPGIILTGFVLSGTPTTPGTTTVTYTVTDDDGDTATLSFDIVVNPTINSIADQTGEAIRALITTGAGAFWYDRINNANIGTPSADSDLDFTDTVSVSRFRYHPTGNEFRTNVSTGQALDFFGPGAVGENSTLHIATPYGIVETTGPDDVDDRFRVTFVLTDAQYALLGNVVEGDLFNIVIAGFTEPPDPEIEIAAGTTPVTEGKDATWTVTADTAPSADLVVGVDVTETGDTIDGTAPTSVTIASGATTATLTVSTLDDSIDETDSVITATVETGTGYTVGTNNSATVTVEDDDLPPDLMPTFGSEAVADQTYTSGTAIATLQLPAATGGDGTRVYSISTLHTGLIFSASLRQITGTPTETGTKTITYTVTDDDGDTDTIDFDITVNAADLMPTLPAITDQTATVGIAFSHTFDAATGGDGTLAYTVSGEPSWMSISGRTLSGTPDAAATHTITVTVTDADGDTDTATFDLVVSAAAVPQITIAADQASVVEGTNVTFTVTATIAPSANLNVHIVVTETGDVIDVTPPASVQILSGATNSNTYRHYR